MSAASSLRNSLRPETTVGTLPHEHIILRDEERQREEAEQASGSEAPTAPSTPGPSPLTKKLTTNSLQLQQSLKREWTKRKYAKYDRNRYALAEPDSSSPPDPSSSQQDTPARPNLASPLPTSYLSRPLNKAKALLHRQRALGANVHTSDTHLDILYENQRGFFLFGHPRYSASTLLPSDPKPWLNAALRTSPVDIRNAQVPDPSWEWAWKSWYVDMSRDVDEEGWEYRLRFTGGGLWHGSHPWFHSFVRRRRWVRLRKRRDVGKVSGGEKGHELTAEYFTIHTKVARRGLDDVSTMPEAELARLLREKEEEAVVVEKMDIADIGSLTLALKKSRVDREKLLAVRKFVVEANGDELYYLSDRMEEIMSLFVFQSSRRQLLTDLLHQYDSARTRKDSLAEHSHEGDQKGQRDHDVAGRKAEHLMRAVQAADEQVKKLEYWSDIKSMAQHGDTLSDKWDAQKWQGLASPSSPDGEHPHGAFLNKQSAEEGVSELHGHAEHHNDEDRIKSKGKAREDDSSVFYDASTRNAKESSSEASQAAYSTAAESVSQLRGKRETKSKGKAPTTSLDGVLESRSRDTENDADPYTPEEDEEVDPETGMTFMTPPEQAAKKGPDEPNPMTPGGPGKGWWDRKQSVELVDPVAEEDDETEGGAKMEDLPSPALKAEVKGKKS